MVYAQSATAGDVNGDGIPDLELVFDLRDLYPGGLAAPVSPTLTLQGAIRGRVYKGTNPLRITP